MTLQTDCLQYFTAQLSPFPAKQRVFTADDHKTRKNNTHLPGVRKEIDIYVNDFIAICNSLALAYHLLRRGRKA
jgi:hypothetical protein